MDTRIPTFGRYRLLDLLGRGGMAEVFKAKSYGVEGFEKVVVIKRILPDLARSQEFVDMFIHEAKLAVRLSHANIVQVFDLGLAAAPEVAEDQEPEAAAYYMAMEFVHGFDLATLLARCRKPQTSLPIDLCVYVAGEIAKGLDHAHRRRDEENHPLGIVHRDVSPQNVLLSWEGEVKVTDFGIAKARGALDASGLEDTGARKLQGKFAYMSPEQAAGDPVDARSDLFSLGTVLYECLAGVNPFTGPTTFETLRRVMASEYPPIELLRPEAPAELVAIVKTAMSRDPRARFPDAARMYEALLAFLYGQGKRFGSRDLADFLAGFRLPEPDAAPLEMLESDHERTPVEAPQKTGSTPPASMEAAAPTVDLEKTAQVGERREVTALVTLFPGRDDPAYASYVADTIARYGGRVFSREDAQLSALFGVPEPDAHDTEFAARAALVFLRRTAGDRKPSAGLHSARIHVSAGGEPTSDDRLTALLATARDLARVREGACAVSATTVRQVRDLFVFEQVIDAPPGVSPSSALVLKDVRGFGEIFGKFVARSNELRKIGEVLALSTKKRARAITILGDHGMGKTRLLVEVSRRLKKLGYNVGWYMTACPPRGRELPLSGIACMLHTLCGVDEGDSPSRILEVRPRLRALGLGEEEVLAVLNLLGAKLPTPADDADEILRAAITRMMHSLAEDRPHVFAWDSAHAMDDESLLLLKGVLAKLRGARIVLVLAAGAGFSHPMDKLDVHTTIELGELAPDDVERLVAVRLGVDGVPEELARFVTERAGGHPLFVEEVLKGLRDARAITVADRAVVTMRLTAQELALPKTLRGLVSSRVARLAADERAVLQACAVLGDPVHLRVLERMTHGETSGQAGLALQLRALSGQDLLVFTTPDEVRFRSPILRDVVVDALPHDAVREMHAAAGKALEQVFGDAAWEHAARVAQHLYEAGDRERAATCFARSGERRLEARQLEPAARDFARALDLCDVKARSCAELVAWLAGLATAVRLVRFAPDASQTCERVIARVDVDGAMKDRVRARLDAGRILSSLNLFDAARAQLFQAEHVAAGDAKLLRAVLVASAELASRQGELKRQMEILERMVDGGAKDKLSPWRGDKLDEHRVLVGLAHGHAARGERKQALAFLERAERLGLADGIHVCERLKTRSVLEYYARDFRAAAALSEQAIDLARSLGLSFEVAVNLHNLGDLLVRMGDFARAYGAIQQSLALAEELAYERLANHNRMFLAYLDGMRGHDDAPRHLEAALRHAEAHEYTGDVVSGRWLLAQLFERRGERMYARSEYENLKKLALAAGQEQVSADCVAMLARLARE